MILILAQEGDETADRFAAYARSAGVHCGLTRDIADIRVSVATERDRRVSVWLHAAGHPVPVEGVLSRGLLFSWQDDRPFKCSETLAWLWCALAYFPGPVVNRPSRLGFFPNLDLLSLAQAVPHISLAPSLIATNPTMLPGPEVNVHRLRDGAFLGRVHPRASVADQDEELRLFRSFDPQRTRTIILAGEQIFDLAQPAGGVAPATEARLRPLIKELKRRNCTFGSLVLQDGEGGLRLLHASTFPLVHQYESLEPEVHHALLEYLLS